VVVVNVQPALWDELAREHRGANPCRLGTGTCLTGLVGDEETAGGCSDVGCRC
jgi:hypothetical protein